MAQTTTTMSSSSSSSSYHTPEKQKSGAATSETPSLKRSSTSPPSKSSTTSPETKALLTKLQQDVHRMDGRLSEMTQAIPSTDNLREELRKAEMLRDELKKMEEEKGETDQVLTSLRGKLDEQKRISIQKRQRLKMRRHQEAVNRSLNTTASTLEAASPQSINGSFRSLVMDGLEDISEIQEYEASDYSAASSAEKEVIELEQKIRDLESQKEEMEQTLLTLLSNYDTKTKALQQEKSRLEDDKDTTYHEMKSLLVEQHEQSERLRSKVSKLERKRKRFQWLAKTGVASLLIAVWAISTYFAQNNKDVQALFGSLNHVCAPARPGSAITEATGPVEAPWWAPTFVKSLTFDALCEDRPRVRLEIQRGTLFISEDDGLQVTKKFGDKAYIEHHLIHISDRGGGHKEMPAPWYKPELSSQTATTN